MPAPLAARIRGLRFSYPASSARAIFHDFSLDLPTLSRTLLIGANGVGKSTLLRLLAGHHLLPEERLQIFGRSPFLDLSLSREVVLVDGDFPIHVDLRVEEMLEFDRAQCDPRREAELLEILAIDPKWRMCRVSEGQRRRVQFLLNLRKPVKLLLLDEITAHLDVVSRSDLMNWMKRENEQGGLTILYATHIFDGLWTRPGEGWPTHLLFLNSRGEPTLLPAEAVPELQSGAATFCSPLHVLCENWIRQDL